jgi:hypothetical protein
MLHHQECTIIWVPVLTISGSSRVDLVKCGQVVTPVQGGSWALIIASDQKVALVRRLQEGEGMEQHTVETRPELHANTKLQYNSNIGEYRSGCLMLHHVFGVDVTKSSMILPLAAH